MEPVVAAGLALAIAPLIVAALENYEHTFQPFLIYSRHRKVAENILLKFIVEKTIFEQECHWLLRDVNSDQGIFEAERQAQLDACYEACASALRLIDEVLRDIRTSTESLDVLLRERRERIDKEWVKQMRQRIKLSFSRNRFDAKLANLRTHVESLKTLHETIISIKRDKSEPRVISTGPLTRFRLIQRASSRLHEALSSLWRCEMAEEHFVTICLDRNHVESSDKQHGVTFDLTWMCPSYSGPQYRPTGSLHFSSEALIEKAPVDIDYAQNLDPQAILEMALDVASPPMHSGSVNEGPAQTISCTNPNAMPATDLQDLFTVPDLCSRLKRENMNTDLKHRVGFLQKTETFKHIIYAPPRFPVDIANSKTIEDALDVKKTRSERISFLGRIDLAQSLSRAVLQFHATPWLDSKWQDRDVVFFDVEDWSKESVLVPCFRSRILPQTSRTTGGATTAATSTGHDDMTHVQSPIRNPILYSLGVMLIELAYDRSLKTLQTQQDEHGDSYTRYWTAKRLAGELREELGIKYSNAVRLCVEGMFATTRDFEHPTVQGLFLDEVVQRLADCARAAAVF